MNDEKDPVWLRTFKGETAEVNDKKAEEAKTLRNIFLAHEQYDEINQINSYKYFQKISEKLAREKILDEKPKLEIKNSVLNFFNSIFDSKFTQIAVTASIFMTFGMLLQSNLQHHNQSMSFDYDVVRGETLQVVENFDEYLNILESELNSNRAKYSVMFKSNDEVELKITLSPEVMKWLDSKRIETDSSSQVITIRIQRAEKK
jgi:hypothetical protein